MISLREATLCPVSSADCPGFLPLNIRLNPAFVSFATEFHSLPIAAVAQASLNAPAAAVRESMLKDQFTLHDFACLLSPAAAEFIEQLGRRSQQLTRQRFGKVIRLFAPLYLSNECINNCKYCGFSRDNPILRVTLTRDEVVRE